MAKDTFYNLSEEKRRLIEEVAIDEFIEFGYDKASVSRIVERSKIAKGSFYQYFKNKKDLLKHIFSKYYDEKLKYLSPVLKNPRDLDFFTLLKELNISGLNFAQGNPRMVLFANQILRNRNHPIINEIMGENIIMASSVFEDLLRAGISRGEIRADIDVKFIGFIISSMNASTIDYYFEVIKEGDLNIKHLNHDVMNTVNLTIDFIRNGLGKNNQGGN